MSTSSPATEIPSDVLDYVQGQKTLTLATASRSGVPHAATMVYVNDGIALYFCTQPDTTTVQHIEQNPTVSFTIDQYSEDWSKAKGIQGTGEAQMLLTPSEISHVSSLFQQKFPNLAGGRTGNMSFFRITPTSLQFISSEQSDGETVGQTMGMDWRRSVAYSVFRELPQQQVEAVTTQMDTIRANPGDVIVRQGAPADKFFIIADGEVEVLREDNGQTRTVARLGKGQFFGEMAVLRDMPRTATVRAVQPTTLLAMDRDAFRGLVAQSLGTTENFDQVIQQRLSELGQLGG